jgi:hypothetical protein
VVRKIGEDGELVRGLLEINEDEAAFIRRIFNETIAGASAQTIVKRLNDEGIPAPGGKVWRTYTVHGSRGRATGILRKDLYRGVRVYGRTRRYHHPKTKKALVRIQPVEEWRSVELPHLRIVSDERWSTAQRIYAPYASKSEKRQPGPPRPKRLLSRLGKCGECGGTWSIIGPDKWGCTNQCDKAKCSNNRIISTSVYETQVLGQLKQALLDTDAITFFVERYNAGIRARKGEADKNRAPLEHQAETLSAKIARLIDAIEDGAGEFAEFKDRLSVARSELADVHRQIAGMNNEAPLELSSGAVDRYRSYVAELDAALGAGGVSGARATLPFAS